MTVENRSIKVGNIHTRYWAEGTRGTDVVLIHGLGGYAENWNQNFETLAMHHRVYALDLPGHGLSDKPLNAPYTMEYFAEFVHEFLQTLGLEHAHVVGHSLGGAVSTQFAIRYPQMVDKLTLVSSAGLGKEADLPTRILTIPWLGEKLMSPSRAGIKMFLKNLVYDASLIDEPMIDVQVQMATQPSAQTTLFKTLRAFSNLLGQKKPIYEFNIRGLTQFSKPLLLLWGREDPIVPVAHAESLAKRIPTMRLKIFEHCKHLPMVEHAQTFNDTLLDWLAG